MDKILIVEDDIALSAGLCYQLDTSGYLTVASYSCRKALNLIKDSPFDLAILDVNLPDGSGFDLCRQIKETQPLLPVVFLTANDLERDQMTGFDLGADDYITKPFSTNLLLRRISAVLRRSFRQEEAMDNKFDDGYLCIDFSAMTAQRCGEKVAITPNEYKILRLLTANAGNIVTRRLLLEKLWDCDGNFIDDHTLTVNMTRLRGKLEEEGHSYIKTIRGMGYIWTGNSQEEVSV